MEPNQVQSDNRPPEEQILESIRKRAVGISIFALALLFFGTFILPGRAAPPLAVSLDSQTAAALDALPMPEILGRAAIIYDMSAGTALFEKNPDAQLPLASITKVMLVLAAGRVLSEDSVITITPQAMRTEGDSGLALGEQWKVRDLIDATLIPSSNDGANALALAAGQGDAEATVSRMNDIVRELGLANTYYLNPTGLDESDTMAGAYGSARDVARLFSYIVSTHPDLLDGTARDGKLLTSESGITHTAVNTNELLGEIPGLVGGKTGYTDLAGGNLAVAFDVGLGRPVVAVVLGSTQDGRFADMRTLIQFARESLH